MNFLNPAVAARLGIPILPPPPHHFTAASGHHLSPSGMVHNVTIEMQNYTYTNSFLLLPVTGCDLVLGAQWLDSLGYIGWHFFEKTMMFIADGEKYVLRGITSRNQTLDASSLLGLLPSDHLDVIAQLLPTTSHPSPNNVHTNIPEILTLLSAFSDIFEAPTALPPPKPINHRISPLSNTNPINVRPYRYAHSQKSELEN